MVSPCLAPTSLPGATCSYLLLQVLNLHIYGGVRFFFPFCLFSSIFWLCPTPDSLQCKTKCFLKIPK